MGQIRNENVKESPMTRFGGTGTPDNRSRRLRNPSFTAAEWTSNNPLLQLGEIGYETDTHKTKIGDGVTYWTDLPYQFDDVGANTDLSNLSATGKANISAQGTYDAGATYAAGTVGAAIQSKADAATSANTDLSNLTATGKNIANWSSNVSNCITEIPQDINLVRSGASFTLKAGSKLYVPNGAGNFDVLTLSADKSSAPTQNGTRLLAINSQTQTLVMWDIYACFAGDTAPTSSHYPMWYDTTNNIIKTSSDYGATWSDQYSLPFAIVTISGGALTSVDNIFNGFGRFSSLIFALPGVAGLIPNGRNADGSLKSTAFKTTSVLTALTNGTGRLFTINGSAVGALAASDVSYSEADNILYNSGSAYSGVVWGRADVYTSSMDKYAQIKEPFRVLDYYDTEYIAHQAMPSSRHTTLTLPASGSTITAPADGYIVFSKASNAANQYIIMACDATLMNTMVMVPVSGAIARCFLPVSKGDVVRITYDLGGSTSIFHFVYANGSK